METTETTEYDENGHVVFIQTIHRYYLEIINNEIGRYSIAFETTIPYNTVLFMDFLQKDIGRSFIDNFFIEGFQHNSIIVRLNYTNSGNIMYKAEFNSSPFKISSDERKIMKWLNNYLKLSKETISEFLFPVKTFDLTPIPTPIPDPLPTPTKLLSPPKEIYYIIAKILIFILISNVVGFIIILIVLYYRSTKKKDIEEGENKPLIVNEEA